MDNTLCKVCNKIFTRKWNLERHLQDIHGIYNKPENQNITSEIDNNTSSQRYNNTNHIFRDSYNDGNMNQMDYSGQYNNYNNFAQNYSYHEYYRQRYPWSNFNLQLEKEPKRWTYDDKIRLQRGLKILQNHLQSFYPPPFVSGIILMLRRKCNSEKSDEPLKKYFVQMNIGDRWPW
jgi:hypothetical protein